MPSFPVLFRALCFVGVSASAEGAVLIPTQDNNTLRNNGGDDVQPFDATSLALKEATSDQVNSRTAFLKFDTTSVSVGADGNQATLTLTTSAVSGTLFNMRVYALNAGVVGYDWNENEITWVTSPAVSTNTDDFYLQPSLITQLGSFDIANGAASGSKYNVPFSDWNNFVQADNSMTLIVVVTNQTSGTPSLNLASSESTTPGAPPLLTIIPEPGSASLALLTGILLLCRHRRP